MTRVDFEVPQGTNPTHCRSCPRQVAWIKTVLGRNMLVDLGTVEVREGRRYAESHFAHCPGAAAHRKSKESPR